MDSCIAPIILIARASGAFRATLTLYTLLRRVHSGRRCLGRLLSQAGDRVENEQERPYSQRLRQAEAQLGRFWNRSERS